MSFDKIIVFISSLFGIVATYWFFLMKKESGALIVKDSVDIIVNGGYKPDVISISQNKTTTLHFLRTDPSTCLEEVVVPDLHIRKYLPLNTKVSIVITPKKRGDLQFSCGMNMFHGKIIVR